MGVKSKEIIGNDITRNKLTSILDSCVQRKCMEQLFSLKEIEVLIFYEKSHQVQHSGPCFSSPDIRKSHRKVTKSAKIDSLFMTKSAEKPYPLGPHIPI